MKNNGFSYGTELIQCYQIKSHGGQNHLALVLEQKLALFGKNCYKKIFK